jgi:hypothetical protein
VNENSVDDIYATLQKLKGGQAMPVLGQFSTADPKNPNKRYDDGAIISYNPDLPFFGKAFGPGYFVETAAAICPSWVPPQPFRPTSSSSPPLENVQGPQEEVAGVEVDAPIFVPSHPPQPEVPVSPVRAEQPGSVKPLWGNPDYILWDYFKLKALCQTRKIPSTGPSWICRANLIRDVTNMCTGQKREFALPPDLKYHTNRNTKNRNDALAKKRSTEAGDGHDAGDEQEPGDDFWSDFDEMDWEVGLPLNDHELPPQQEKPASGGPGASAVDHLAEWAEEMDWEADAGSAVPHHEPPPQGQQSKKTASRKPGAHRAAADRKSRSQEVRGANRESTVESIVAPVFPPPYEGNIVGRRPVAGTRIRKLQVPAPDTDDEDAFDALPDLRKKQSPSPHPEPQSQERGRHSVEANLSPPRDRKKKTPTPHQRRSRKTTVNRHPTPRHTLKTVADSAAAHRLSSATPEPKPRAEAMIEAARASSTARTSFPPTPTSSPKSCLSSVSAPSSESGSKPWRLTAIARTCSITSRSCARRRRRSGRRRRRRRVGSGTWRSKRSSLLR